MKALIISILALLSWTSEPTLDASCQTGAADGIVEKAVKEGNSLSNTGRDEEAMASFERALALESKNIEARRGEVDSAIKLALKARKAGDMDGALVYLARARKSVPNNPTLLLDFGVQADLLKLYRDADEALTQALAMRPDDPQIIYAMGRVKLDEQRLPEAEQYLRKYIAFQPNDPTAHYGLGHILRLTLKDEEAQAELHQSIKLQPAQTESYYELGIIAAEHDAEDEAVSQFQIVTKRNPEHGGALAGLGMIAYKRKNYIEAVELLKHSIRSAPDYVEAHRYLGMALAKLGRNAESAQQLAIADELAKEQTRLQHGFVLEK
ncbi:MAG TPA: tetratricopeptide repeat protein [Edaphobacter sp.]